MASESVIYVSGALNRMTEKFGAGLQVCTVVELNDRGVLFVEDGNHGENRPRQNEFAKEGIAFLRPPDLKDGRVDFESCGRITDAGFRRVRKGIGQRGDIILTHRATVGRIAITGDDAPSVFVTNPGTTIWRSTAPDILDQQYLYCFMRSDAFMQQLMSQVGNTSTFDYVSLTQQRGLHVAFPPLNEQKHIANILRTLDDKIDLNRRMNATLEGISRVIFKSWFVDFDPVRQKAAGKQPLGMDAQTAALFPDSFEESEIGEVPKGWGEGVVGDLYDITMGQSPPGDTYNESGDGLPFFQGRADFSFRYPERRVFCTTPTRLAAPGDTLVSVRAPVGDINMALERCAVGRGVAAVRHKTGAIGFTYYSMLALSSMFEKFEGEGTVFGSMGKKEFHGIKVVAPAEDVIHAFEHAIAPQNKQIENLERQTANLAALRDTLLPKLLSGEIRVPEAEESVTEAVR